MPLTLALYHALVDALTVILPLTSPADIGLKRYFKEHPKLGLRDRAFISETVYTVLRHRRFIEHVVTDGSPRRMALVALTRFMGISVRDLHTVLRGGDEAWLGLLKAKKLDNLAIGIEAELPDWIIKRMRDSGMPDAKIIEFGHSMMNPAPLDLRVNSTKAKRDAVLKQLLQEGLKATATPHSSIGIRLDEKPSLTKHPAFIEGFIEVQDEGSQILGLILEAKRGEMVVDFCAGAGGKSLLIAAQMASAGRVYAFDVSEKRLTNLAPRLKRSGLSNITPQRIASEKDTKIKRLAGKIDRVLVDAPCTGFGTLRRNPDLKFRQTDEAVVELNVKQASILNAASKLVAPGGRLVYATCSVLPEENEKIVEAFLSKHSEFEIVPIAQVLKRLKIDIKQTDEYLRLSPKLHNTDGFFAAVMQRTAK
ncbi:MAG: RsmB/NOP family class I SAM-dependent RNA methyltransferase [Betaproteobacteria bacterium]|jgi:16S rRNA (cytosine967-C5)-methyltransferase|nr:SAM-dependent methyltransferase [Betaproteobacteria bacterium UKL13-2]HCG54200.1 SAM-dependent methyltransferase [Betaproteobacteria bacterium]